MSPVIKRGGDKFTLPSKYLLFILTILCTGLIIITFNTTVFNSSVNSIIGTVIVPFQKGITTAGTWCKTTAENLETIHDLLSENESLKNKVEELTTENTKLEQDKYELTQLRELYALDSKYSDYQKIGARIIAKDTGNWYHSFVINKGSDEGVAVDMNVIAGGGLVGRITDVGPDWAKVQTIIADNSSVSGTVLSASENLIATGDLELYNQGQIAFSKLVDEADKVSVGDKVVTSNISDKYLPGILIGYISEIEEDSNNLTKSGKITPVVDFEYMDVVLVITTLKSTGEQN